jgi:O-antigen/teichoic acid export membrane protein
MSLFLPLAALSAALLGATRGYRTMRPTVVIDRVARPLFQVVVAWITTSLGAPMAITALGWASAYVGQMLFAWLWLENLEKNEPLTESVTPLREAFRTFWRFTLPRAAATSMRTALQWFDVVLVAALSTPEDAAVYTVCTRLLQLGMLAAFSVGQAVEPLFGESVAARESARTSELYKVATAWLMLMTWPIYFVLAAFAAPVLSVFGSGFASGATAVLVLVVSVLIGAAVGPADILLVMTGRTMWSLWNTAASLAANLALNIVLIPRLGLIGAAVAWTVGRTVANLLPAIQLWRSEEMHPVSRGWALAAGLSVGIFAVPSFAARFALGPSLLLAVGASALLTAGFLVAVRRFREPLALDLAVSALRRRIS